VDQQLGAGVDLADPRGLGDGGQRDVAGDEVDAGDIEAERACGADGDAGDLRVDQIGDVGTVGADPLDEHAATGRRDRVGSESLPGELRADAGVGFDCLVGERFGAAAPGIVIELGIDQRGDRPPAVAGDVEVFTPGAGDHPLPDHQEPVLDAGDVLLDDHGRAGA
jgi:hypothetical protein